MLHVGEKLYKERIKKNLTLEEISKATRIRTSFLLAIENSEYKKLPSITYAQGFVRNYAKFLKLPEHEVLALFKREYNEKNFLKVLPEGLANDKDFSLSKFKISQTMKILSVLFIALLIYMVFQYRAALFDPSLTVSVPAENSIVSSQEVVVIGKTDPDVTVFVNSEPVSLDKDGNFRKTVNVFPGKIKIIVKSINNFERTTTLERNIEVKI